ncbi:hypothetical protein KUTeg_023492 [Tegillarca granosa]|uniref:LIM zinc-binding domain-containing protein n=1 Tax=Tegillarca granosa TaxID=220873 RepID=A0ABQ9E6D7_TEGGR|nr:hypothetical protein KUTeg_023492 [Tegillarca granosa]
MCLKEDLKAVTMSDNCPRCGKQVYFAEKIRVFGTSWHKLCLKCANCNKLLDSSNAQEHEGEAFCKSCYGKLFGPKGYGFSGGAAGLSMDAGKYGDSKQYDLSIFSNISHLAKAQVPPSGGEGQSKWGGADGCPRCGKPVYFAEECRALGAKFHKMCLACVKCNKLLDSTTCNDHDGEIFCKNCYSKSFGPKGYGFAGGASGLSMDTGNCNKMLDSTTCTDHGDEIYCKACYGKLYGPKGYGFAGGASGLSMDTGNPNEVTRENVSEYSKAQAAPSLMENGNASKFGGAEICGRCGKAVYFAEKVVGGGNTYHKSCFKCTSCGKNLDSTTLTQAEGEIFCKACYGKHFGPKGFGFGQALQHTN